MAAHRARVFVSHIHEEAPVAGVIRNWVNDAFTGSGVTAFVSSDRRDLPAGRKWLDVVKENLDGSKVLIAVLSPASIKRPWPNIELGAAWLKEIAVIPFCHSGIRLRNLDRPFNDFHGVDVEADDPGRDLLAGVADALGVKHPENLDFAKFKAEVLTAAGRVRLGAAAEAPQAARPLLPEPQARILLHLAMRANEGQDEVDMEELSVRAGIKPASLIGHTRVLHDQHFARITWYPNGSTTMRLQPRGSTWLEENGLMPK
jgi:hypothetical protein